MKTAIILLLTVLAASAQVTNVNTGAYADDTSADNMWTSFHKLNTNVWTLSRQLNDLGVSGGTVPVVPVGATNTVWIVQSTNELRTNWYYTVSVPTNTTTALVKRTAAANWSGMWRQECAAAAFTSPSMVADVVSFVYGGSNVVRIAYQQGIQVPIVDAWWTNSHLCIAVPTNVVGGDSLESGARLPSVVCSRRFDPLEFRGVAVTISNIVGTNYTLQVNEPDAGFGVVQAWLWPTNKPIVFIDGDCVLSGSLSGDSVKFGTNAAPENVTVGTTEPDLWIRVTNSAGAFWTPCWTNHPSP